MSWRVPCISTAHSFLAKSETRVLESEKHSSFRCPKEIAAIKLVLTARASAARVEPTEIAVRRTMTKGRAIGVFEDPTQSTSSRGGVPRCITDFKIFNLYIIEN